MHTYQNCTATHTFPSSFCSVIIHFKAGNPTNEKEGKEGGSKWV